jgi:pSer/pThr/pTyr-binding forkhead associated (FHA) protein/ribosomal protein L40E
MSDPQKETRITRQYIIKCIKCDLYIPPDATQCPQCGTRIAPGTVQIDNMTESKPPPSAPTRAIKRATTNRLFAPDASVLLRFMPLGQTLTLPMQKPLLMGRAFDVDVEKVLDLTNHGGQEHGVSRRHCQLQRRGTELVVMDLGSTNGTFLNGRQLSPHKEFTVGHGDRLILGTMHILVLFSSQT